MSEFADQPPEVRTLEPGHADSLPPTGAAAERVVTFLQWYGDGLVELSGVLGEPRPPLYARDLEALTHAAHLAAQRPTPAPTEES